MDGTVYRLTVKINILVVILYQSSAKHYLWRKLGNGMWDLSTLFLTTACESRMISKKFN